MTTMQAIVEEGFRRCAGLIGLGETPSNEEMTEGLTALNRMMHGWKAKGVDIEHTTLTLAGTFPLDPEFEDGVAAMLAVRLAGPNGASVEPQTVASAQGCWTDLLARYIEIPDTQFDIALTRMPSQRLVQV